MNTIVTYRKTGLRFAVLILLGMVLTIVAQPTKAFAFQTPCERACQIQDIQCVESSDASGQDPTDCFAQYEGCIAACGD
jgi:hypothetical protein